MKYYSKKQWTQKLTVMVFLAMALGGTAVQAMPSGADIRSGQGSISQDGKNMTIQQNSQRMAIDWTKFDIDKDETVRYAQPDRNAISLNRVTGGQQSVIAGNLNANGNVVLVNPNGVVFTKNSSVDVGGLVASTARLNDEAMKNFGNGKDSLGLSLDKDSTASVINEGQIKAQGGLVALHAANVENKGNITNEGGTIAMAAAKNLTLSAADDDKLNFTVDGELAKSQALNSGSLKADGGYVVMTAKSAGDVLSTVVNNNGTIEAKTLRKNENGQILLDGGDNGQVEVSGTLDASGTEAGQDAGNIKVIGQKTIVHDNTNLLARGDVDGGKIETSGDVLSLGDNLHIDAKGVNGKAGEWLLDPLDVIIADSDPTGTNNYSGAEKKTAADSDFTSGSASIDYNDPDATTANASSVNSAVTWISTDMVEKMLNAGTNVTIQAAATNGSANIIVKNDIDKTAGDDATFTLDAMRNITINGNITSKSNKLNVVLNGDSDGDQIGAVIINADIKTNGGYFTSASGGTVKYTSDTAKTKGYGKGTLTGTADPAGHTVGTYFGHVDSSGTADGAKDDRLIQTNGGKITLNGEVAIGLNGGTLTLDSSNTNGTKGDITVTGIINSGNSYGAYVYGTTTWDELTADKVNEYLTSDTVPAYHYQGVNYVKNSDGTYAKNEDGSYKTTTDTADFSNGEPHYIFDKETDTQNIRWLGDGSSTAVSVTKGKGYSSVIITEGKMSTKEYLQYVAVSDPAGFLSRYMTSNPTVTVGSTSYTLTVASVKVNGVDNNALGYNVGGKFTALTQAQIQSLADSVLILAKNSADTTTMSNGSTAYTNLTNDIKQLIASNWFVSEDLAKYDPQTKTYNNGKSAVGDSYLATITTVLENSLTTPNGQQYLWVGGRGSGVLHKTGSTNNDKLYPYSYWGMPDDPTYQDGMYWVTGPEGEANNGKGTQFYSNAGSDWSTVSLDSDGKTYTYNKGSNVYGFVNWDTWSEKVKATDGNRVDVTRSQPDNSSPFLTVGYGTHGKWDDGAMGGATTVGFVKETNLANSSLNIKAGSGEVKLQGDIGKAKALDTVNIESTGAVTVGTDNNNVTDYYHGTVYVDHGLYISGNGVTVGGEIHSGESEETDTSTTLDDKYKDSVTIESAGNIEVHGITSNTYTVSNTDGTTTTRGGKISLTSTGDKGRITLGAGVDYNGNATAGTLAAASADKGAVVIDAQGSQGSLVNSTTGTSAITTGTGSTWQVYVNSPSDYGTSLGSNLISGTNAQWTAKSDANSTVTANSSNKTLTDYTDTSSNKFIFQMTPVITISGGYASKTYGDTLSEETMADTLTSKATYKDSSGNDIDVTSFKNFDESSYLTYVTSSDGTKTGLSTVSVSSDGAAATATRTNGNEKVEGSDAYKTATDGNRAFYVMDVAYQDGVKTLNGYDKDANAGEVEITRKTLNISTDATQTYGNTTVKSGTPSYDKNQLVNGDTLADSDIKYTISTDGTYATSKGSNDTAHVGKYEDQYLTSSAEVKSSDGSDASANYEVTGSGTITVDKAPLVLNVGDVSTTYGTAFDPNTYSYTIDSANGLVNGDTRSTVLGDSFLSYTNTGDATDADKIAKGAVTQNAGTYALEGTPSSTLSDYNVTVNNGTSTVEKAKLTLTVGDTSATYGSDTWTPYTYTLEGNVNGDTVDDVENNRISVTYTNGGMKTDANNPGVKTQDVGSYDLTGEFTLSGDTAVNYEIDKVNSKLTGTAKVNQAEIHLKFNDVSTTYGTAFDTSEYGYDVSKLTMANGDSTDVVTKAITNGDITYTNTGAETDAANIAQGIVTKDAGNYTLSGTTDKTLTNYQIVVDGAASVVHKAKLTVEAGSSDITYGDVSRYGQYDSTVSGAVNGNTNDDLKNQLQLQYSTDAYADEGTKTNHVRYDDNGHIIGYDLTVGSSVTDPQGSLKNYDVSYTPGTITVNKAKAEVTTAEKTTEYGTVDTNYQSTFTGAVNGDDADTLLNHLKLSYTTGAYTDKDGDGLYDHTADVIRNDDGTYGSYALDVANQAVLGDYDVTIHDSDVVLTPKAITVTNEMTQTYGDSTQHFAEISTPVLVNGDSIDTDGFKIAVTEGDTPYQTNRNGRTTADVGEYDNSLSYSGGGIQHEDGTDAYNNYDVTITGKIIINPATLYIDTTGNSRTYGDVAGVIADLTQASQVRDLKTAAVNGDDPEQILKDLNIQDTSDALVDNQSRTNDVGSYDITTTYNTAETSPDTTLKNYTIVHNAGKETITKAPLTITTGDVTTDYGTVKETTSTVSGLTNGDTDTNLVYDYGNYGGGYLDDNTRTNHVGDYDFTTNVSGSDFLKNYDITGGNAKLTITPKDVYFHVDGSGSTFDDIIYTVTDPNHPGSSEAINSQLPYGETVTGGYGIGQALPDTPGSKDHYYTVDSTINGTPVYDNNGQGTQVGNYVFHPTGQAVIHFDQPQKPDQTTRYVEGARRPQDKMESALPVFRVDGEGQVKQYGTYGIESRTQTVILSPTGMRMPEPNQTSTQDRKYMTSLKTPDGQGTFRLEYNGVVLRVIPVDPAAEQVVEAGDKLKNVALSEQALHVAYTQMGLDLVNLKGVYIYMTPMSV
ncbi:filamentous hemagglutinin N-terminal domain-containing protein [Megasphaera sp. WILCCON 0056]|uniref:two-partner secretion domain-containing protein n=1 Tax=Megasphaera sp. WILCCON 0056 TaxID=3345340 RepID=UPI003A7FB128